MMMMTILNETLILKRLVHPEPVKRVTITPLIRPEEQFGPTSVDLRLGTDFQVMRRSNVASIDPLNASIDIANEMEDLWEWITIPVGQPFVLHPGEFALASTLEHITLPLDLSARLEGRSTWGRLGLQIHATAGFVDPGFSGSVTFELSNVSMIPLPLYPGVRISQLRMRRRNCRIRRRNLANTVVRLRWLLRRFIKILNTPASANRWR